MNEYMRDIIDNTIGLVVSCGLLASLTVHYVNLMNTPTIARLKDVNKDGIEDIVLYNSKNKPVNAFIFWDVEYSHNEYIKRYVESDGLLKQAKDMYNTSKDSVDIKIK